MLLHRIVDLEQGSPQWLDYRKTRIGGSDAPIIMGASPWTTIYQLYCQKMDIVPPKEKTPAMQRGHDLEPVARAIAEDMLGHRFTPVVVESIVRPFLMVSLDGLSEDGKNALEIKCPNEEYHKLAAKGVVPEEYTWQLYHIFNVMPDLDRIMYLSYHSSGHVMVDFKRDTVKQKLLLDAQVKFMECMNTFTPPELCDKDYRSREDSIWKELVGQVTDAQEMVKGWTDELEKRRLRLIEESGQSNTTGAGVRLTKVMRRGSIDYAAIPELLGVNLDLYRKRPSESWRITNVA